MTLTIADYVAIAGLLITLLALPGTMMMRQLKSLEERLNHVGKEVQQLQENKVGVKNWVQVTQRQINRSERLGQQLAALHAKFDTTVGNGHQLKRIGDAVEKLVENA